MNANRLVVACRMPGALAQSDHPLEALARLEALVWGGVELGGALAASSFDGVAFSWPEDALNDAIQFAIEACHVPTASQPAFAAGVAMGELHEPKDPPKQGTRMFAWGAPLAVASALARVARPREVLLDTSVPGVVSRELLVNRGRVGRVSGMRVRGLRLEARQPWRAVAARDVARMVDPALIGRQNELDRIMGATELVVLRADSGFGGSRLLAEVAAKTKPSRAITLTPFAVIHEPLGALRRAMAFVAATERITLPPDLHPDLDRLLGAQGVSIEKAGILIAHQLRREAGGPPASLLLDDASDIDAPSLDACGRAMEILAGGLRVVARIDSMSQLPQSLARFAHKESITLDRLSPTDSQTMAAACTGGTLETRARVQWGRRGGGCPLGVVEAVAAGIAKGELIWSRTEVAPLKRAGGDDIARPVAYWIAKRAEDLEPESRDVLTALAHLGGEATANELYEVVTVVTKVADLEGQIASLMRARWIREHRPGYFTVISRAHREAILEFSRDSRTRDWRGAVAATLERADGTLRRAEAAQHAARCGQGPWSARLATSAAQAATESALVEAAASLLAFAAAQDPLSSLELSVPLHDEDVPAAPAAVSSVSAAGPPVVSPARPAGRAAPPPLPARASSSQGKAPSQGKVPVAPALPSASRLPSAATAVPAMNLKTILESSRELRETRWAELARGALVPGADARSRSRGLLALGRAYAEEGRSPEALVHAVDALARAREAGDGVGIRTCLLFLARMYERTERDLEATRLREAAQKVG